VHGDIHDASVIHKDGAAGVVAYTRPYDEYDSASVFFLNPDVGINMAINGGFSDTPDVVCNGSETSPVDWVFSEPVGNRAVDESTAQANNGTKSVVWVNARVNDVVQFTKTGPMTIESYVAFTMSVYIDSNWGAGDEFTVSGWDTGTGLVVGNTVNLTSYINEQEFGLWQNMTITYSDLGLLPGTLDAMRVTCVSKGATGPTFYMDDLQFEQTGTPREFRMLKETAADKTVVGLRYTLVDDVTAKVADGTVTGLSYNKILGLSRLPVGIQYKRVENGQVLTSVSISQLSDMFRFSAEMGTLLSDGTNTMMVVDIKFTEPVVLVGSAESNYLSLTISDDLSGLILFNAVALSRDRTPNE
jgi:hypothetical protein